MIDRESGYYWVKLRGKWVVGEFKQISWLIHGREYRYSDTQFDEIYENRITLPFGISYGTNT